MSSMKLAKIGLNGSKNPKMASNLWEGWGEVLSLKAKFQMFKIFIIIYSNVKFVYSFNKIYKILKLLENRYFPENMPTEERSLNFIRFS